MRHFFGKAAKLGIEGDIRPAARLAVKERPRRNRYAEHLLQADRLCAELDFVGPVRFGLVAFVFDGERASEAGDSRKPGGDLRLIGGAFGVHKVELHHIRDASDAESM